MKKNFTITIFLFCFLLLITTFSSCSKKSQKVISVYRCISGDFQSDSEEILKVQTAINKKLEKKGADYSIKLVDYNQKEYFTKVSEGVLSGEANLFWTTNDDSTFGTEKLVKDELVYDFTQLLQTTLSKNPEFQQKVPQWFWKASAYNDKNYFFPCYNKAIKGYNLVIPSVLSSQLNFTFDNITTLKALEPYLEKAKAQGIKNPYFTQFSPMFRQLAIDDFDFICDKAFIGVDRDTNSVVNVVRSPEYIEFCKLMSVWAEKGYINKEIITSKNKPSVEEIFDNKEWAFTWWESNPDTTQTEQLFKQPVETAAFTKRFVLSQSTLDSCYGISAKTPKELAEACLDFLITLYTDKTIADLYTFGIEKTDYSRTTDGTIERTGHKYSHEIWSSGTYLCSSLEKDEPAEKVKLFNDFNNDADISCALGFNFDYSSVQSEYEACRKIANNYEYYLENGGIQISDLEATLTTYQALLNNAGYQKILVEAQKQYKAWKAKK